MSLSIPEGYKQTEVGVIPEDWRVQSIGQTFNLVNGCAFKPSDWETFGTPIIRIQNLNNAKAAFNYFNKPFDSRYEILRGDLLWLFGISRGQHNMWYP